MGYGVLIFISLLCFILGIFFGLLLTNKKNSKLLLENTRLIEANKLSEALKNNTEELIKVLQEDFKSIANQALIDNQNQLSEQNKVSIEEKLKPLNSILKEYQEKVEKYNLDSAKDTVNLKDEISKLIENTKEAHDVTKNLTNALTLSQNKKGAFGEGTLEVIFNYCGFVENVHYIKHFATSAINEAGDNKTIYPDFVVNLPENKNIVIDVKTNYTDYLKYQTCDTKADKEKCLSNFKKTIKGTITDLADKNYQNAEGLNSPDFVFMYIPIENALAMIYEDMELVNYAYQKNIILIGNISLLTTLRIIKILLAQQKQQAGIMEIIKTGASLYDKFATFCSDLQNIQKKLSEADKGFKTAIGRFSRGEDSLFKSVEKLKTMGIISAKEIPEEFLEQEDNSEIPTFND